MKHLGILCISFFAMLFAACENDVYDTGTGEYSLLTGDFAEAHSAADCTLDYILTDDGERLFATQMSTHSWMQRPDTLYRAMLYYNKVEADRAEIVSIVQVPTLAPRPLAENEMMKSDPVTFESMWVSKSGKYLNMSFYLKVGESTGKVDGHVVGMVVTAKETLADGKTMTRMEFYHDQGGVPEYYSSKYYVSIPTAAIGSDSVSITLNTYKGTIEKKLKL